MEIIQLLLIAGLAVAVLAKLYSVLGQEGDTPMPQKPLQLVPDAEPQSADMQQEETPEYPGSASFQKAVSDFHPSEFIEGARSAYEMIVTAYANGDRTQLKELLDEEVYESYSQAISEREAKGQKIQIDIVRMMESKIINTNIENKTAFVTVEFHTDLSVRELLESGEPVNEEGAGIAETVEQWTFSRPTNTRNPNWELAAVAAIA